MFKRLVSRLPYSPSLISQVGQYAAKLKREIHDRKTGLGLLFAAVIILIIISTVRVSDSAIGWLDNSPVAPILDSLFLLLKQISAELPRIDFAFLASSSVVVVVVSTVFYLRAQLLYKELRIVRNEFNVGDISKIDVSPTSFNGLGSQDFKNIMRAVRKNLSTADQIFSRVIHLRIIDASLSILGASIFRPLAIIVGSITSIIAGLSCYVFSLHRDFRLNTTIYLMTMAAGWLFGLIVDWLKTGSGRRN